MTAVSPIDAAESWVHLLGGTASSHPIAASFWQQLIALRAQV
jgi:hypothetical protein